MPTSPILDALSDAAGNDNVITDAASKRPHEIGYRSGSGEAIAVVYPDSLLALWHTLQACHQHNALIIAQAANTGLTEGSTPNNQYDRPVVILNTMHLKGLHFLDEGRQVVSLPGATLFELSQALTPIGREPHSVIGSTSIGATVIGGVCNNSGGALCRRGPAYTELALYARINENDELELINELGIDLGDTPEEILPHVEKGNFAADSVRHDAGKASDDDYQTIIRGADQPGAARYNNDPRLLHGASGSAGKVVVFAVRLDTFEQEKDVTTYYVGTNDTQQLTDFRFCFLREASRLPITTEYLHRELFDIAKRYGKDSFLLIKWLGTQRLPGAFSLKNRIDAFFRKLPLLPAPFTDHLLQATSRLIPSPLPKRLDTWRDAYEHHLIIRVNGDMTEETEHFLDTCFDRQAWFRCTADEGERAMLHRFAAAGAAVRYRTIHHRDVEDILALDIALSRNDPTWFEQLPESISKDIVHRLYYGHFFCYVFHQDYIFRRGADVNALKKAMLDILDARGAEYPAEHNVGHLYPAKEALATFYRELDPTNRFNPGIGKMSRAPYYRD
ncbi:D-lactate dehydrogenase [Halomonas llamarensis]|uniref:Quinone-dependent D-lactate dehydrogenase n=1 Tax=Halomonas llamarensis TaxID=2945104 RepID=A0ABT0SKV5_9GAMM|nr:D-lactate dehydrogenase [Halomonas llamarensis]MCL7928437.1 D-lactate dehydrogenase [Halomonas llamarensis]